MRGRVLQPGRGQAIQMAGRAPRRRVGLPTRLQQVAIGQSHQDRVQRAGTQPDLKSQLIAVAPRRGVGHERRENLGSLARRAARSSHAAKSTYVELDLNPAPRSDPGGAAVTTSLLGSMRGTCSMCARHRPAWRRATASVLRTAPRFCDRRVGERGVGAVGGRTRRPRRGVAPDKREVVQLFAANERRPAVSPRASPKSRDERRSRALRRCSRSAPVRLRCPRRDAGRARASARPADRRRGRSSSTGSAG